MTTMQPISLPIIYEGYMYMKMSSCWKQRYFTVTSERIFYRQSQEQLEICSSLNCKDIKQIHDIKEGIDSNGRSYLIALSVYGSCLWRLSCIDQQSKNEWMEHLKQAILGDVIFRGLIKKSHVGRRQTRIALRYFVLSTSPAFRYYFKNCDHCKGSIDLSNASSIDINKNNEDDVIELRSFKDGRKSILYQLHIFKKQELSSWMRSLCIQILYWKAKQLSTFKDNKMNQKLDVLKFVVVILLKWMQRYDVNWTDLRGDTVKLLQHDDDLDYCYKFVNGYCLQVFCNQKDDYHRIPFEIKQLISMYCYERIILLGIQQYAKFVSSNSMRVDKFGELLDGKSEVKQLIYYAQQMIH